MKFQLLQALEVLVGTPQVLRAMLQNKSPAWAYSNYGPNTFSPFDVVGHLIHGEQTDWISRVRMILEHDESRTFEPFDRYAMFKASKGKTIADLLDEFEQLRSQNIRLLKAMELREEQMSLRGMHPGLGSVTLEQLLATWVVHDLNHIAQIAKAMSFQYENEVGPWREYLSILRPPAA